MLTFCSLNKITFAHMTWLINNLKLDIHSSQIGCSGKSDFGTFVTSKVLVPMFVNGSFWDENVLN